MSYHSSLRRKTSALVLLGLAAGWMARADSHAGAPAASSSSSPVPAASIPPQKLFRRGEQLSYVLYWGPIEVGHADWYVWPGQRSSGEKVLRSVIFVRTNASVDSKIRVRAESIAWAAPDLDESEQYITEQAQRTRFRDFELRFDNKHSEVNLRQIPPHLLVTPGQVLPPPSGNITAQAKPRSATWPFEGVILDPISALAFYRTLALANNFVQHTTVCDISGVHDVTVRVVGYEKVSTPTGDVNAWIIEPDLPGAGLFLYGPKHPPAPLRIWIADDNTRRPVRFAGKVGDGAFTAELASVKPFNPPPPTAKGGQEPHLDVN
jgi:Protein of unknown function (DUF3108)